MKGESGKPQASAWGITWGIALTLLLLGALSAVVTVGYMGAWGLARQAEHAAALEILSRQQRQIAACLTRAGLMDSVIDLERGRDDGAKVESRKEDPRQVPGAFTEAASDSASRQPAVETRPGGGEEIAGERHE